MELLDLELGLKYIASGGNVLNCQELTGLQAGLTVLRRDEKLRSVYLWGKVFGVESDYYIAYSLKDSDFEFPSKSFYFAKEDFQFQLLPPLTEEMADRIIELNIEKPFIGKADLLMEPPAEGGDEAPAEEGQEGAPPKDEKLREHHRLSQVVQEIDFDTAVVPKGAHALNEAHVVVPSSDFKGLGMTEATSLSRYVHFRQPTSPACLRALARTDAQFFANFLDPLEGDLPRGCWALRQDASAGHVTLRSLSWPGYIGYHVPQTTRYGGLYFGYGQKNRDLPFML